MLLAAQISSVYEIDNGVNDKYSSGDTLPVINDSGTVLFVDPQAGHDAHPFSWMTNGGVVLPGLTSGYLGDGLNVAVPKSISITPADLNNSNRAVLIQFLNPQATEQELVVYDITNKQRLATVTTLGQFRSFREPQINDAGEIAVIAEEDSGMGGIYFVEGGTLVPALVRQNLARNLSDLKLLNDGRAVFMTGNYFEARDMRYTVTSDGTTDPFSGSTKSLIYFTNGSTNTTISEPYTGQTEMNFTVHLDLTLAANDPPISVRFRTRDITATAGTDYQVVDRILTFDGTTKDIDVKVPILADGIWEGGIEVFAADLSWASDPWQYPFIYLDDERTTRAAVIHDSGGYAETTYTIVPGPIVTEPNEASEEIKIRVSTGWTSAIENTTFQYVVVPLTATSDDVVMTSGTVTLVKDGPGSIEIPITVRGDTSSAKMREKDKVFFVLFTREEDQHLLARGTYVRIVDNDFIPMAAPSMDPRTDEYGFRSQSNGNIAINGLGDMAYLSKSKDKIVVISGDRVVQEISEEQGLTIEYPIRLSDEREVVFAGRVPGTGNGWGLYRGLSPSSDKIVDESDLLSAGHYVNSIKLLPHDFSMSAQGNIVFGSSYKLSPDGIPVAGYGVYSVMDVESRRNLLGSGFVVQNPPGNDQARPPRRWGDTVTINFHVTNQGNVAVEATTVRFVASSDSEIELDDLKLLVVSGNVNVPALGVGQSFAGQVTLQLPEDTPAGFEPVGTIYLGMITDEGNVVNESDENDNLDLGLGIDKADLKISRKEYVNILIHGFDPAPTPGSYETMWDLWESYGAGLEAYADQSGNEKLHNNVSHYSAEWKSSEGWYSALIDVLGYSALQAVRSRPINPLLDAAAAGLQLIFLADGERSMKKAAIYASNAAKTIVEEVLNSQAPEEASLIGSTFDDQWIHVIGHSRGGAVGAEVVRLLREQGYHVDQYTALDGYSTDWPDLSSMLGDFNITATLARGYLTPGKQINYRVDQGLVQYAADTGATIVESLIETYFAYYLFHPIDVELGTDFVAALADWRAPVRNGKDGQVFEDVIMPARNGTPSNHLNISDFYFPFN
ncbi:MAG: Calx-beta domain-containing protein, partial [Planctomycetaceae bacterium]